VFDVGTWNEMPFMVLEYLEGNDLDVLLGANGPLPIPAAVDYVLQTGEAIAEAHTLGIIHRDLKPANLYLTARDDGTPIVKILDFGVAKLAEGHRQDTLTQSGQVLGTPAYIAPEQIRESASTDGRADLYSVGVILYELVTGHLPFETRNAANLLVSKVVDDPDPLTKYAPDLPPAFVKLVMRAIDRDPNTRPKNCAALAAALEPFLEPSSAAAVAKPSRHRTWLIVATIVAAIAAAGLVWNATRDTSESEPPAAVPTPAPAVAAPAPPAPPPPAPAPPPPVETHTVAPPAPTPAKPPVKPSVKPIPKKPRDPGVLPDSPLAPTRR